ncbi:MAG: ABC transporter substrate-binding protein [Nocardioidaceae bacterium]
MIAACLAVALAGCGANDTSSQGPGDDTKAQVKEGGTLHYLSTATDMDFEPASSQNLGTSGIHLVHRALTGWVTQPQGETKLVPDLATDTGVTHDGGKTWTYHLQKGLKYSDGSEITAQGVKYGIERSFAPALQGGLGYHKQLLKGGPDYKGPYDGKELDSIEVNGKYTITFHLNKAFGNWPWIVSMPMFAPVPEKADTDPTVYGRHPVASGPYKISVFKKGTQVVLTRNKYWKASTDKVRSAGPEKIEYSLGQNNDTVIQQLIDDQGDAQHTVTNASITPAQISRINSDPSVKERVPGSPSGFLVYLAMNTQRPGLDNVKVRQAIEYAVNKQEIQKLAGGEEYGGKIASTLMTPGIPGFTKYNLYDGGATGDIAKAKSLMHDSGEKNLSLSMVYSSDDPGAEKQAESVKQALGKIGISVELQPMDANSYTALVTGDKGDYDLTISGWLPDFPSGMGNIQPLFASSEIGGGGYNLSRYSNPKVDAAITKAAAESDLDKAGKTWSAIDKQIMADAPVVPLLYQGMHTICGSKVKNCYLAPYPPFLNILDVGVSD